MSTAPNEISLIKVRDSHEEMVQKKIAKEKKLKEKEIKLQKIKGF